MGEISEKTKNSNNKTELENISFEDSQISTSHNTSEQNNSDGDIELIKDIPMELSIELGRTKKSIKDILDFGIGTVIELNRTAGEPVDLLANGKLIAKGEVVVIDENFAIRITKILKQPNINNDY